MLVGFYDKEKSEKFVVNFDSSNPAQVVYRQFTPAGTGWPKGTEIIFEAPKFGQADRPESGKSTASVLVVVNSNTLGGLVSPL